MKRSATARCGTANSRTLMISPRWTPRPTLWIPRSWWIYLLYLLAPAAGTMPSRDGHRPTWCNIPRLGEAKKPGPGCGFDDANSVQWSDDDEHIPGDVCMGPSEPPPECADMHSCEQPKPPDDGMATNASVLEAKHWKPRLTVACIPDDALSPPLSPPPPPKPPPPPTATSCAPAKLHAPTGGEPSQSKPAADLGKEKQQHSQQPNSSGKSTTDAPGEV